MPAAPLTLPEREEIRAGIERAEPATAIAARLGRHRTTVSAELARNGGRCGYRAAAAQARADRQRSRPKVPALLAAPELGAHVAARLAAKDSPMTIARELAAGVYPHIAGRISHESIYQAVYGHGRRGPAGGAAHRAAPPSPVPQAPPWRGRAQVSRLGPLGTFRPIAARPPAAVGRGEVGHLEGDLIIGARGASAIITVFDRASRYLWLADLPEGHGAEATLAGLVELIERLPVALRRSLTWDQGREMAGHARLAELVGIEVYFADAHSPWQRPTNENGNGLLRRYVGKSTDLAVNGPADLRARLSRVLWELRWRSPA